MRDFKLIICKGIGRSCWHRRYRGSVCDLDGLVQSQVWETRDWGTLGL